MQHTKLILILSIAIAPLLVNGFVNAQIYSMPLFYWSFELLTWIVLPMGIFMATRRYCNLKLSDIGISQRIFGIKSVSLVLVVSVSLAPTIFLVYKFSHLYFEKIFIFEPIFEYETMIPQNGVLKLLVTFYFSLSAGVVEEFYRGLVYKLSGYYSRPDTLFLILSPLFFALPHWENGLVNLSATYVVGLFLAIVFLTTKNLIPLMVGHIYTDMVWFN